MPAHGNRRLALVTGATQGIGQAIARRLAAEGLLVAVNGRQADERMAAVVDEVGGVPAPADMADRRQIHAMVQRLEADVGPVEVLVANHAYMSMGSVLDYPLDDWWKVIDTNLGGTFHVAQAVVPGMLRLGRGRIVIISSEWGVIGWPKASAYSAAKSGLASLAKTLGRELAPRGVIVNAVAPGVIDTPQLEVDAAAAGVDLETMRAIYAKDIPLARIGRPEEVAALVAQLCRPEVEAMVGQVVQINGGTTRARG